MPKNLEISQQEYYVIYRLPEEAGAELTIPLCLVSHFDDVWMYFGEDNRRDLGIEYRESLIEREVDGIITKDKMVFTKMGNA